MRVAVYARVSTTDQTCEQQLTAIRAYCAARKWKIDKEYVDTGISGAKTSRPGLDSLLKAARTRKIDVVIVWKLDRFGRSLVHFVTTTQELDSLGVRFIAITQGIDTDKSNPASRLLMHIFAAFAEFERELMKERTVAGIQRARSQGIVLGRKRATVDLQKVREMHATNATLAEIARATGLSRSTVYRTLQRIEAL